MPCRICNNFAAELGDGHPCVQYAPAAAPAPVPTGRVEAMFWVCVGLIGFYLVVSVVRLVFSVHETSRLVAILGGASAGGGVDEIDSLRSTESLLTSLQLLALVGYIVGYVLLFRTVRTTVSGLGLDHRPLFKHWTVYVWQGSILALLVVNLATPKNVSYTGDDLASEIATIQHTGAVNEGLIGFRVFTLAVLLVAVVLLRRRTLAVIGSANESRARGYGMALPPTARF